MLTIDLGNSRLKALRWTGGPTAPEPVDAWQGEADDPASFSRWLGLARAADGALSSVADEARTARVVATLRQAGVRTLVEPAPDLENRCQPPEGVGRDRLYAAAGAAERFQRSCVVLDAGTALTVDALEVAGGRRAFLGGAIAPGPALLASALAHGTARLPHVVPVPGASALGRATEAAIQSGIGVGFRGAAQGLLEGVLAEAGLVDPLVVVTGGARAHLLTPRPFTARPLVEVPELVHHGLLAALLRALARAEGA